MNYKTIKTSAEAEYEISKSRFLTYLQRVDNEAAALAFIQQIKKLHWEARHNCSAYVIGAHGDCQRADDDGEPSGTAGKPILEILKKNNLKDIVIVVTRYFGGIKLGAGGLIRAYGKAASLGIAAAEVILKTRHQRIQLEIDYALLGTLENKLRLQEYRIESKTFTEKVQLTILVKSSEADLARTALLDWTAAACTLADGGEIYLDLPDQPPAPIR